VRGSTLGLAEHREELEATRREHEKFMSDWRQSVRRNRAPVRKESTRCSAEGRLAAVVLSGRVANQATLPSFNSFGALSDPEKAEQSQYENDNQDDPEDRHSPPFSSSSELPAGATANPVVQCKTEPSLHDRM